MLDPALRAAAMVACAWMLACGPQEQAARRSVEQIGAAKLLEAAQAVQTSGERSVPEAEWPEAIRSLEPQAVLVKADGVFVRLASRLASESGVLITFDGASVPTQPGQDPAFEKLADGVYWYEIKG